MSELIFLLTITIILLVLWLGYLAHCLNKKVMDNPVTQHFLKEWGRLSARNMELEAAVNEILMFKPNTVLPDPDWTESKEVAHPWVKEGPIV